MNLPLQLSVQTTNSEVLKYIRACKYTENTSPADKEKLPIEVNILYMFSPNVNLVRLSWRVCLVVSCGVRPPPWCRQGWCGKQVSDALRSSQGNSATGSGGDITQAPESPVACMSWAYTPEDNDRPLIASRTYQDIHIFCLF